VRAVQKLPRPVSLEELKASPKLADMQVVQRGARLSVQPVTPAEWREILRIAGL
jgi:predicted RNA-binding protein with PUA-like domain